MRTIPGKWYRVSEGSGLDSGRIGEAQVYDQHTQRTAQLLYPYPYNSRPFDPKKETLLMDDAGSLFIMFNNRLEELDGDETGAGITE